MEKVGKISLSQLKAKIADGNYVLYFKADWCSDCRFIAPEIPTITKDFSRFTFIEIDRDQNEKLGKELKIDGIPSYMVYKNGHEVARLVNKYRKTKQEIEDFLSKVK